MRHVGIRREVGQKRLTVSRAVIDVSRVRIRTFAPSRTLLDTHRVVEEIGVRQGRESVTSNVRGGGFRRELLLHRRVEAEGELSCEGETREGCCDDGVLHRSRDGGGTKERRTAWFSLE